MDKWVDERWIEIRQRLKNFPCWRIRIRCLYLLFVPKKKMVYIRSVFTSMELFHCKNYFNLYFLKRGRYLPIQKGFGHARKDLLKLSIFYQNVQKVKWTGINSESNMVRTKYLQKFSSRIVKSHSVKEVEDL